LNHHLYLQFIPISRIISIKNLRVKHQQVERKIFFLFFLHIISLFSIDSPGIPPSADAHDSFQGFSYIAPELIHARQNDPTYSTDVDRRLRSIIGVKLTPFNDEYDIKEALGHGKTSTCYRCIHRQTREEYAVKIIKDAHINDPSDEIELLFRYNQLTHIIRVKQKTNLRIKIDFYFFIDLYLDS
jgi:p90 ribosomal S6 kinase